MESARESISGVAFLRPAVVKYVVNGAGKPEEDEK
jgi:hypothetical protein